MSHNDSSTLRRRGTGTFTIVNDYPNYLPVYHEESHSTSNNRQRKNSFHSFLSEKSRQAMQELEDDDDVKADVLYPHFKNSNNQDDVDMDTFHRLVQNRARKLSEGTLQLTKTLSRQNQLYGSSKMFDMKTSSPPQGPRFTLYSSDKSIPMMTQLDDLLNEQGKAALEKVVQLKGWWVDVLCPSFDEMAILSKTFRIHPLTAEDIQAQEQREKVELFPNYTFVCFRSFDIEPITDQIKPYNYYCLIFKDGFLTFHFKKSDHFQTVRERCDQLKEYMTITPDWMNYALIDAITDSFAPIILQVEFESVSIDELSLMLRKSEQADMLKRISRCRKKSTQLSRLLGSKLDVIRSLKKRYEDKNRELSVMEIPSNSNGATSMLQQVPSSSKLNYLLDNNTSHPSISSMMESKKSFTDVLLYLGDIQDHVVTMVQNINHYDRILHRAHTNYLAQVNLELTQTYNMTNGVMNRLTFMATVFIPLTLVGGLWGMNVYVPGKQYTDSSYFFWILGGMAVYCLGCIFFGKRVGIL